MTASDHLSPHQFVTLYHGTHAKNVDSIKESGLRRNTNAIGAWATLTDSPDQALRYARADAPAVVKVRTQRKNLTEGTEHNVYGFQAKAYGLLRDIPAKHIR